VADPFQVDPKEQRSRDLFALQLVRGEATQNPNDPMLSKDLAFREKALGNPPPAAEQPSPEDLKLWGESPNPQPSEEDLKLLNAPIAEQPSAEDLKILNGPASFWTETVPSLPERTVRSAEMQYSGAKLWWSEPQLSMVENTIQEMFNMSPEAYVQAHPDHYLAQRYLELKPKVDQERLTASNLQAEMNIIRPFKEGLAGRIVGGAAESLGAMLPGFAVGAVTGNPFLAAGAGIGLGSAAQTGGSYLDARDNLPPEKAAEFAARAGFIEGAFEGIPFFGAANKTGMLAKWLTFAKEEAGTEFATQFLQSTDEKLTYRPDKTWMDILQESIEAGASGGLVGVMFGPASSRLHQGGKMPEKYQGFQDEFIANYEKLDSAKRLAMLGQPVDLPTVADQVKAEFKAIEDRFLGQVMADEAAQQKRATELGAGAREAITGMTNDQQMALLQSVADAVTRPENPETVARLGDVNYNSNEIQKQKIAAEEEIKQSMEDVGRGLPAQASLTRYVNPNDATPTDQLPVLVSTEGTQELGSTIRQVPLTPGSVRLLGVPSIQMPTELGKAMVETVQQFARKYMPDASFFIVNQTLSEAAGVAGHLTLSPGVHLIFPRNMTASEGKFGKGVTFNDIRYNPQTAAETVGSLDHEMGHALERDLIEVLKTDPTHQVAYQKLEADWRAKVDRIMSRQMTAAEFGNTWLGPWKLMRGLLPTQKSKTAEHAKAWEITGRDRARMNSHYWLEAKEVSYGGRRIKFDAVDPNAPAIEAIRRTYNIAYYGRTPPVTFEKFLETYLSFPEFFAEQTSRYQFHREQYRKVGLGNLFDQVLNKLRQFFKDAKSSKRIAPTKPFAEFMDELTMAGGIRLTPKPSPVEAVPQPTADEITRALAEAEKTVAENPQRSTAAESGLVPNTPEWEARKRELFARQQELGLPRGSVTKEKIRQLIKAGEFQAAAQIINDVRAGKDIHLDLRDSPPTPEIQPEEIEDWKEIRQFSDGTDIQQDLSGLTARTGFIDPSGQEWFFKGNLNVRLNAEGRDSKRAEILNSRLIEMLGVKTTYTRPAYQHGEMVGLVSKWQPGLQGYIDVQGNWSSNIDLEYQLRLALGIGLTDLTDYHEGNIMVDPNNEPIVIDTEILGGPQGILFDNVSTLWKFITNKGRVVQTPGPQQTILPNLEQLRALARTVVAELDMDFLRDVANSLGFEDDRIVPRYMAAVEARMKRLAGSLGFSAPKGSTLLFDPEKIDGIQLVSRAGLSEEEAGKPTASLAANIMWRKFGTKSPFFLRWFGDWTKNKATHEVQVQTAGTFEMTGWNGETRVVPNEHSVAVDPLTGEPVKLFISTQSFNRDGYAVLTPNNPVYFNRRIREKTWVSKLQADRIETMLLKDKIVAQLEATEDPFEIGQLQIRVERLNDALARTDKALDAELNYLESVENRAKVPVYTSMQNPMFARFPEGSPVPTTETLKQLILDAQGEGHDGLVLLDVLTPDGTTTTVYMPVAPWQVKYATDKQWGSFSDSSKMNLDLSDPGDSAINQTDKKARKLFGDSNLGRSLNHTSKGWMYNFLQTQQLAHLHPESEGFNQVSQAMSHFTLDKLRIMARGEGVMDSWNRLSFESTNRVESALRDEFEKKVHWTDIKEITSTAGLPTYTHEFKTDGSTFTELKRHGIDVTTQLGKEEAALFLKTKNALMFNLDQMTRAFLTRQLDRMQNSPDTFRQGEAIKFLQRVKDIRNKPFLPQQRFGKYLWEIQRKNEKGNWVPIHREALENEPAWIERGQQLKVRVKGANERILPIRLHERQAVLMMLPYDFAEMAANELGLAPDEIKTLVTIMQPLKQDKFFKGMEDRYLAISGASPDFLRSLASFFWHNSNQIAKLDYKGKFNQAMRNLRAEVRELADQAAQSPEATKAYAVRENLLAYAEHQIEYAMHPADEFYRTRSALSIAFLWGNVKTATLNLYGLVTTWADLTSALGFVKGNGVFLGAVYDNVKGIMGRHAYTEAESKALEQAHQEGLMDQAYAYYLAAQATAGNYSRAFSKRKFGRIVLKGKRNLVSVGMWPFRATEIAARRITFLAKFRQVLREEMAKPESPDVVLPPEVRAYNEAARVTNLLQNDYTQGNRIPLMQGKTLSLVTLFMSFTQHMMFHAYGGYEKGINRRLVLEGKKPRAWFAGHTMKIWLTTLLLAGLEGLPGFENILDILDLVWRKLTGKPLRMQMRQVYHDVTGRDPSEVMYGLGHNVLGFDISRSLGFGRVVPATDVLTQSNNMPADVMNLTLGMAGIAGSFVKFGLNVMYQKDKPLTSLERYTTGMPGGVGNFLRGLQWSMNGARGRNGSLITRDLESGLIRDLTGVEIGGAILGFQPTAVSQEREKRFEIKEAIQYWQTRRSLLLNQLWYAHWTENGDLRNDVNEAIGDYNREVPYPTMRITGETRRQSLRAHMRQKMLEERNIPSQKAYRPLAREVEEAY